MTSEIETNMVSVERISEYQNTPQEAPFSLPENDPPKEWPQYGVVKFENYQTRYREGKKCYFSFWSQFFWQNAQTGNWFTRRKRNYEHFFLWKHKKVTPPIYLHLIFEILYLVKAHSLSKKICTMIPFSKKDSWCQLWLGWKGLVRTIPFSKNEDHAELFTQWMDFNLIFFLVWNFQIQIYRYWNSFQWFNDFSNFVW